MLDVLHLCHDLVAAPSPTGEEEPALLAAESRLRELAAVGANLRVERLEVDGPRRFDIAAWVGTPRVILTTHLDTVPPGLPIRVSGDLLEGRGACDAKGSAASMLAAAEIVLARGRSDFGILFVVGEETTSDGALAAQRHLENGTLPWTPRAALFGEPTDNRWVSAHAGALIAHLVAHGRAAHSSHPEEGRSAVHALVEVGADLVRHPWPMGNDMPSNFNIGRIEGGAAPNVIAERASADVMLRHGLDPRAAEDELARIIDTRCEVHVTCSSHAVRFAVPPGGDSFVAPFCTDAPCLPGLGTPYLLGPGSVRHAHAVDERVTRGQLESARDAYVKWMDAQLENRS